MQPLMVVASWAPAGLQTSVEISIVLPCLSEEAAIGGCNGTLRDIIERLGLSAEIVVVVTAYGLASAR